MPRYYAVEPDTGTIASMAWNHHSVEETQLRGQS